MSSTSAVHTMIQAVSPELTCATSVSRCIVVISLARWPERPVRGLAADQATGAGTALSARSTGWIRDDSGSEWKKESIALWAAAPTRCCAVGGHRRIVGLLDPCWECDVWVDARPPGTVFTGAPLHSHDSGPDQVTGHLCHVAVMSPR